MLMEMDKRNPELVQAIRQKMFTFEDLAKLDLPSLQKIMREVDTRDLAISLKAASATVKAKLLSAISKRAAETVNEEISFLGPIKKRDTEAAQCASSKACASSKPPARLISVKAVSNPRDEVMA